MKTLINTLPRWTRPTCYIGTTWEEYFVFLGRTRDSDCLTNSNFDCAFEQIGGETGEDDGGISMVAVVRESHWACGWVEWIAIHESNTEALRIASEINAKLENYPVLDENHLSEREGEEADRVWSNCYDAKKRIAYIRKYRSKFDFNCWSEVRAVVEGKYFNGCTSELIYR